MFRILLSLLLIVFPMSSWAIDTFQDLKLKKEYGDDLMHAPFFLRFAYTKAYNQDWDKTNYAQREDFLYDYEVNYAKEMAKQKAEVREEAQMEKDREDAKKDELRRQRDRLREEIQAEEQEKLADEERQKTFEDTLSAQKQELKDMERQISR